MRSWIALAFLAPVTFRDHLAWSFRLNSWTPVQRLHQITRMTPRMAVYSSQDGVPAALVEERDACGVGFIASLDNEASHDIIKQALSACSCMEHRGASSADNISGDGAGVMTAIPWNLFGAEIDPSAVLNKDGTPASAVGMFFLPRDEKLFLQAQQKVESIFEENGFEVKQWRTVPTEPSVLGALSADFVPRILQGVVQLKLAPKQGEDGSEEAPQGFETEVLFERKLYDIRRQIQGFFRLLALPEAYTCSLSGRTIVYKGMLRSCDLGRFYKDLLDPAFKTPFAIYHRRFSTNTVPKWFLAQPMRRLAHNGEINTLLGNINWVRSRQYAIQKKLLAAVHAQQQKADEAGGGNSAGAVVQGRGPLEDFTSNRQVRGPLVDVGRSDSANLDSVLESFVNAGYTPEEALMILVPEAYSSQPKLNKGAGAVTEDDKRNEAVNDFYRYYESVQEAWDGPALLVFSDGKTVGATLDRNGLRPARYMLTSTTPAEGAGSSGKEKLTVHVMSEVGVTKTLSQFSGEVDGQQELIEIDGGGSVRLLDSGRLGPGEMLSVNLQEGKLYLNDAIKQRVAAQKPYKQWIDTAITSLPRLSFSKDMEKHVDRYISDPAAKGEALELIKQQQGPGAAAVTQPVALEIDNSNLIATQSLFGWGTEDVEVQITAMASKGMEATYSMGDDAPLAALSVMPHTLYDYFKQRFAQVTNPPIDPLREGAVMSLNMFVGPRGDPLRVNGPGQEHPETSFTAGTEPVSGKKMAKQVRIDSPVLNAQEFDQINAMEELNLVTLSTHYPLKEALTQGGLKTAIDALCARALDAVKAGSAVINLSDEFPAFSDGAGGVGEEERLAQMKESSYIPPLLAVAAVHHHLIREGVRTQTSIVVTTAQAWATHHFACLVGYGATAVVPYAAYSAVLNWHAQKRNQLAMERGDLPKISAQQALDNYRKSVDKGLLKILSKMGISLLKSYQGAQIFESLGLADEVLKEAFTGTPSRVAGLSFDEIAAECADFSRRTFGDDLFRNMVQQVEGETEAAGAAATTDAAAAEGEREGEEEKSGQIKKLFNYGFFNYFKSGDYHHNNQPLVKTLHSAIREHKPDLYELYEQSVTSRPPTTFRDALQFRTAETVKAKSGGALPNGLPPPTREPIPLEQVESADKIMRRFCTGGMSLGALSREAHETLAISMNRIGGRSNSGEGGEDPVRKNPIMDVDEEGRSASFPHLKGLKQGDVPTSRIKQVASGRFGVTPEYLMSADQLEIKIAQGAKPGEGGQLPGAKIDQYIATLRKSKPGVTLISPPPHHDIYSIEDLAQLIYDLHQINPSAGVSVKLVSEVGIGTVASGVAKAGADIIQIAGHDGGTGASPASSIKHAGSPWELGLVETHSTLLRNGLRDRVLLRVDGGLKSGWDVVMAAAMGAEEFGFGTIALIAEGCIMARICHTNKCPVGVTTQNEALRKRFPGTPDNVVTFFGYVAEEVRQILAKLGYSSLDEIIGRPGLLEPRENLNLKKTKNLDVDYVLDSLYCIPEEGENFCEVEDSREWLNHGEVTSNGFTFDDMVLQDEDVAAVIESNGQKSLPGNGVKTYQISNIDRTAFARISGKIAKKYGDSAFQGRLRFSLTGAAGQAFCAFLGQGMEVKLSGYANDYVGKGMNGGRITVTPPAEDLTVRTPELSKTLATTVVKNGASSSAGAAGTETEEEASPQIEGRPGHFSVVGNTVLYGATGGKMFVRGRAGERFAVRNSGAVAVVEGLGDHGCEYMTAGTIVALGSVGRNFGAGMTGGLAFIVTDEAWLQTGAEDSAEPAQNFVDYLNPESVALQIVTPSFSAAREFLAGILGEHVSETGSVRAQTLLSGLDAALAAGKILVVVPNSEKANPLLAVMSETAAGAEVSSELAGVGPGASNATIAAGK